MEGIPLVQERYGVSLDEMPGLGGKRTKALIQARKNSVLAARVLNVEQYGWLVQKWNESPMTHRRRVAAYCGDKGHAWRKGPFSQVCIRCCATGDV